jgi:hypothetical protein
MSTETTEPTAATVGPQVNPTSQEVAEAEVIQPHPAPPTTAEEQHEQVVTEARITTVRAQLMKAQAQELREAWQIAKILTHSTSINPEFQADAPEASRTKWKKNGQKWEKTVTPPLGEQAIYNGAVAIVYGAKLGWTPEESLMRVFSVHGKPAIEAKDALGFIRRFIDHRIATGVSQMPDEGGDDIWPEEESETKAIWYSRRNGRTVSTEWSMERAIRAGYAPDPDGDGKTGNDKYETNPIEMLRWKCVMELARMQWSDVLRGVQYSREELQLEDQLRIEHVPVKREPEARQGLEGLRAHRAALTAAQEPESGAGTDPHDDQGNRVTPAEQPGEAEQNGLTDPQDQPGATNDPPPDSPATPEQLKAVLAIYKPKKMSATEMLGDLAEFLIREAPLERLQQLTFAEAADVIRASESAAADK